MLLEPWAKGLRLRLTRVLNYCPRLLSTPVRTRAWKLKNKNMEFQTSNVVYREYLQNKKFNLLCRTRNNVERRNSTERMSTSAFHSDLQTNVELLSFEGIWNEIVDAKSPIVIYRGNFDFMKNNCQVTLYFEFWKEYQKVTKGEYILLGKARHLLKFFFWF